MYPLLVMTISGSVLALVLLCLRYTVLRKMPSTVYYYAWLLVLLRFALPLPGLVPTSLGTANVTPAPSAPAVYSEASAQENIQETVQENIQENTAHVSELDYGGVSESDPTVTHTVINEAETQEITVSETSQKATLSIDWKSPELWLSIWATGAIVSMGITVFSYLHFNFKLKKKLMEPDDFTKSVYASIPGRKPALYISDSARTPMFLGVIKPMIVLPYRRYNEELLLNILRHELTHYRRFDTIYKWGASAVLSMHWFNPVAWFIHREFNRACELSCDEMLLRSMNKDEKQSYGNSLLLMAAQSPLPSAVVATSFATEKRNLKERLVQIMNYKKSGNRLLSSILAVVLLTGCAASAGPVFENASGNVTENMAPAPGTGGGTVQVKTVDEFLSAIAPNTVIELAEGEYDLSTAANYDQESGSQYYYWEHDYGEENKSAELIIHDVEGLTIRGAGIGKTTIAAVPRFACVIRFCKCSNITVSNLTAGHTKEPGFCTGDVLLMDDCTDTTVDSCGLFGCGTIGVHAIGSKKLRVTNCDIYECSVNAVSITDSEDVMVSSCDIRDIGLKGENEAYSLFDAFDSSSFTVYNCRIHDSKAKNLLYTRGSYNVMLLSNDVTKNTFTQSTFYFETIGAIVDGCRFEGNTGDSWYMEGAKIKAVNIDGKELDADAFKAMEPRDIKPNTVTSQDAPTPAPTMAPKEVAPGGEITVTTVDEFLSALGSDRTIVLDGTNFILTQATDYGTGVTDLYNWCHTPDGPSLIIYDIDNLTIKAKNTDPAATVFEAVPGTADVLTFVRCDNITLTGFTLGHKKDMGDSANGVLEFEECSNINIENMRINGCGGEGIETRSCKDINIKNTEIFECGPGAGFFTETNGINFTDCNIHDVKSPVLLYYTCANRTWNGKELSPSKWCFDVKPDGTVVGRDTYD